MQLQGTLDQFPLRELIEMIVYSSVTGALELCIGKEIGALFVYDGRIYHAIYGEETGLDAVGHMFEHPQATFQFNAGRTSADESLWHDPLELIEQAEQQAQQWQRIRPFIPSLTYVPALHSHTNNTNVQINEANWPILAAVDGQQNIAEIAQSLNMTTLNVCVGLVALLEQKLISLRQPRPALFEPRRIVSEPAATPEPQKQSAGFLDRLLAQAQQNEEERRPDLIEEEPADLQRSQRYVNDRYINSR